MRKTRKNLLNTEAFLKAAAACEKEGGGVILFAGDHIAWALYIPSHTTLFIAADSEIKAVQKCRSFACKKKGANR